MIQFDISFSLLVGADDLMEQLKEAGKTWEWFEAGAIERLREDLTEMIGESSEWTPIVRSALSIKMDTGATGTDFEFDV